MPLLVVKSKTVTNSETTHYVSDEAYANLETLKENGATNAELYAYVELLDLVSDSEPSHESEVSHYAIITDLTTSVELY